MDPEKKKSSKIKSYMIYIIVIIVLILIIVYFAFFRLDIKIKSDKILRCADGTVYDSCSINKPFYCSNGTLISIPSICGCINGMIVAANECKNASDLLPNSNFSCKELVPKELFIRYSNSGIPAELIDRYNSLTNNIPLKNVIGKYCLNHLPARAGENINVGNLFYCYGYSYAGGEVDSNEIVKESYKISYEFTMDKSNCTNLTDSPSSSSKKCNIISINCSWIFTN